MKTTFTFLKSKKWIAPLLCLILGGFILMQPDSSTKILAQIVGALLAIHGLVSAVTHFWQDERSTLDTIQCFVSLLVIVIGVWVMISPNTTSPIIPILLALFILLHGVQNLFLTGSLFKAKSSKFIPFVLLSILILVLAILLLVQIDFIVKHNLFFTAIALLIDGLVSFALEITVVTQSKSETSEEEPKEIPEKKEQDESHSDNEV